MITTLDEGPELGRVGVFELRRRGFRQGAILVFAATPIELTTG